MSETKLTISYDEFEEGIRIVPLLEQLADKPEARELEKLVIGDWGSAYENDSAPIVEALVRLKDRFPKLRSLFIGDMEMEECEVSWIVQSNVAPVLPAYPGLRELTIKGSTGLELEPAAHEGLEELTIICGGLGKKVLHSIANGRFPRLKKLELYLGVEDYGFDGDLSDVLQVVDSDRFPELVYLGLKDSAIQDEIALALADHPILDQLHTLDLSQGTLSDKGAEALLNSMRVGKLQFLDLSYHYMSDEMTKRWQNHGINVEVSDQQEPDDDYRYPALTE